MGNFKGAIFDMDGTLLDSMFMWDEIASTYLNSRGIMPKTDLNDQVRSKTGRQVAQIFKRDYGIKQTPEEIIDDFNDLLTDFYTNKVLLKPGVSDMLAILRQRGINMCVATATDRHLVEIALRRTDISDFFSGIFTCTEAGAGKDMPDIFCQALTFLGTGIDKTVIFEDAFYAIQTAKEAGFTVAAVYDVSPHHHPEDTKRLADYYIPSFNDWDAAGFDF